MGTSRQLTVRHVRQEDPMGCFVAAMAMVTGKTYQQVKAETGDKWAKGATYYAVDQYLAQNGFALARFWSYDQFRNYTENETQFNERLNPWPLLPFAPVHVLQVNVSNGSHWIVMLEDGTILDPATDKVNHLVDYIDVIQMCGVWKVKNLPSCPVCFDQATYQTPDGKYWCSRAHWWNHVECGECRGMRVRTYSETPLGQVETCRRCKGTATAEPSVSEPQPNPKKGSHE